jgi:hypothetical protein
LVVDIDNAKIDQPTSDYSGNNDPGIEIEDDKHHFDQGANYTVHFA